MEHITELAIYQEIINTIEFAMESE